MVTALSVAKAYAQVQKAAGLDTGASPGAAAGMGGGFGDILKSAMADTVKSTRAMETQITNQVQGKADLVDVVTAVSAAQESLQTVMAVRDQVINAYQEIMKMPI